MDENLVKFLKQSKLFSSVDLEDSIYLALLVKSETIYLAKDEILFREGDSSHFLYILIKGRLNTYIATFLRKMKPVGNILPGDTVGDSGVLSNDKRAFTAKAEEDSELLKLPTTTFKKLCRQYPGILLNTTQANRTEQIIKLLSSPDKKHIVIFPANVRVDIEVFVEKIKNVLRNYKKVALLNDWEIRSEDKNTSDVDALISEAEENNHIILYVLKFHDTPLAQYSLNKVDKIYIVAHGNEEPFIDEFPLRVLNDTHKLIEVRRELILMYGANETPLNSKKWLLENHFYIHHNIKKDSLPDFQRLMRFMRGKAQGLVLGGGGVKGWAQIGALKAIIDAGISIDAVGGTSVGAVVAGLYAMFEKYEGIFYQFSQLIDATRHTVSFKKLNWPAISLFDAKQFTIELTRVFDVKKIEDLWIPYFCISTNLGTYRENIHRDGYLWEKIRGSASIPGIVPPLVLDGQLHVDGGLVNNLPVNIMKEILGPDSKIIAVELTSSEPDTRKYNFPPTLTFKEAFLSKVGLGYRNYHFPPFLDTFLKSLLVGSSLKQEENARLAHMLISMDTHTYSMLNLKGTAQDMLFNLGYEHALQKIEECDFK